MERITKSSINPFSLFILSRVRPSFHLEIYFYENDHIIQNMTRPTRSWHERQRLERIGARLVLAYLYENRKRTTIVTLDNFKSHFPDITDDEYQAVRFVLQMAAGHIRHSRSDLAFRVHKLSKFSKIGGKTQYRIEMKRETWDELFSPFSNMIIAERAHEQGGKN